MQPELLPSEAQTPQAGRTTPYNAMENGRQKGEGIIYRGWESVFRTGVLGHLFSVQTYWNFPYFVLTIISEHSYFLYWGKINTCTVVLGHPPLLSSSI